MAILMLLIYSLTYAFYLRRASSISHGVLAHEKHMVACTDDTMAGERTGT